MRLLALALALPIAAGGAEVRIPSAPEAAFADAGVFALAARTICGCQSNQTEYVHATSEPAIEDMNEEEGPCEAGQRNHIGVASTTGLLLLRNAALAHVGLAEYGYDGHISAGNGFSAMKECWKCNRFVADGGKQ